MNQSAVLIVDDEVSFLRSIRRLLWQEGYTNITLEQNPTKVPELLRENDYDLMMLDVSMPEMNGLELLEIVSQTNPQLPVIMVTANDSIELALNAVKLGAYEYITKPPDVDRLFLTIKRALEQRMLHKERDSLRADKSFVPKQREKFSEIVTNSPLMEKVFDLVEIFAPTNETVLITGETGTGKDLIAKKLHELSPRKDGPLVVVNLVSISSTLFESELFGHEKGSFTGAANDKAGYFESANNGTIFLDEIGELPKELQGKLLRTIQYGEIYRIGNPKPVKLNIRIITATNRDLIDAVNSGEFRADLFYRLNRGYIFLPPLRARGNDIRLLAEHFLKEGNKIYNKKVKGISPAIYKTLRNYNFPGNVRELENFILNAVAKTKNYELISELELPPNVIISDKPEEMPRELITIEDAVKNHILFIMKKVEGNLSKAASILGVSERTLQRRIKQIKGK